MTDIANALEAIRQALGSHEQVSEYIVNLDHMVALLHEKDAARKIGGMRTFLRTHVIEHFAFEESTVFPSLLAVDHHPATRDLVAELLKEHVVLLEDTKSLADMLLQGNLNDGEYVLRVEQVFRAFFGKLQRHASKEDTIFIPFLIKYGQRETRP
ncbi:MAG: hemerythrin domain-containing protein [Verrucomicrobiia bacterium]